MTSMVQTYDQLLQVAEINTKVRKQNLAAYAVFQESLYINYNGGIFKADANTILMAQFLAENTKVDQSILPDINNNPIAIADIEDFVTELRFTFNEAMLRYRTAVSEES